MKVVFLLMLLVVGFAQIKPTSDDRDAQATLIKAIDAPETPGQVPSRFAKDAGNTPDDLNDLEN